MPVPDFQSLMLPTLKALADGQETPAEVCARVAASEGLTPDDMREMIPSGRQAVFTNRVSWAVIHMERADLVQRVRRAVYRLTDKGKLLLGRYPERIDLKLLRDYPSYTEWRKKTNLSPGGNTGPAGPDDTPGEALDRAAQVLHNSLETDVLDRVRKATPAFLEQVVVDLLIAMGYGGGDSARGRVTGKSGDGGIDGTIREDALGLDEVYVQAKKYAKTTPWEKMTCEISPGRSMQQVQPKVYLSPPLASPVPPGNT